VAVTHTFAGLAVADYAAAYDWYVRLLGRPADMFPHDREAVWRLTANSSIYVVEDLERAGTGLVTLALDDLEAHEKRLRDGGLAFTEQTHGAAPRRVVVRDLDGNTLTVFHDLALSGV
jgi:glyoxylase I family protein